MLRPLFPITLAMLSAACATTATGQGAGATAALPAENFDYTGWDAYLGGAESSQYSSLDQINKGNVNQLQVAWTYMSGDGQPPTFNPIVANGMMYVQTGDGKIAALDPATGREIWKSETTGRVSSRGINYWQSGDGADRRLLVLNDGLVRAIDARTGKYVPDFSIDLRDALPEGSAPTPRPLMTNNPGRIYKDTFIVSLPAGAYDYASSPADIQAYDIRTGALKWVFNVIPKVGEFGSETWPETDREKFGGGHNWSESTVDTELGMVYIPTGTARYDFFGGNREGDNLFTNSIVAIDAETGERVWHFQTVHHDLWDFDLPAAPKLMTITKDGQRIPILVQPTKQGFLFTFDRRTGEPVWPIIDTPVPASDVPGEKASPTQPIPSKPERFGRDHFTVDDINPYIPEADQQKLRELLATVRNEGLYTPPSLRGSISMPGHNGGANWGNVAADPERQRIYVVSREIPLLLNLQPDRRPEAKEAMPNSAGDDIIPYRWPTNFLLQSNGMVAIKPPFSQITAYDMNTGDKLYEIPNGEIMTLEAQGITGVGSQAPRGGPVATAGGLLFVGTATDRKFRARDADTGAILWEHELPAATEGVPAVYEVNGRQYVTIPVGGIGHFANGLGLPDPGPSQYMTFALPARGN